MTIKKQRAYSLDDVPQTIARTPAVAMPIAEPVIRVAFATSLTTTTTTSTTTTTTTAKTYRLSIAVGPLTARPSVSVRASWSKAWGHGASLDTRQRCSTPRENQKLNPAMVS